MLNTLNGTIHDWLTENGLIRSTFSGGADIEQALLTRAGISSLHELAQVSPTQADSIASMLFGGMFNVSCSS